MGADPMVTMILCDARFFVWSGPRATTSVVDYVVLGPGDRNVPHEHPASEDCTFILVSEGCVQDVAGNRLLEFEAGSAELIWTGLEHGTLASRGQRVISVGEPTLPDLQVIKRVGGQI